MILAVNSFLTINCLVLILSLIAMLCLIMYPTNMSLYYKNIQCNNELSKKQISNCNKYFFKSFIKYNKIILNISNYIVFRTSINETICDHEKHIFCSEVI